MKPGLRTQQRNYKDVKGLSWSEGAEWNEVKVDWWTAIPVVLAFIMSAVALGFGIAGFVVGKELQPAVANNTANISKLHEGHTNLMTELAATNLKLAPAPHVSTCMDRTSKTWTVFGPDTTTTKYVTATNQDATSTVAPTKVSYTAAAAVCSFTSIGSDLTVPPIARTDNFKLSMSATQLENCGTFGGQTTGLASTPINTGDALKPAVSAADATHVSDASALTTLFTLATARASNAKTTPTTATDAGGIYSWVPTASNTPVSAKHTNTAGATTYHFYSLEAYCDAQTGQTTACIKYEDPALAGKTYKICGASTA